MQQAAFHAVFSLLAGAPREAGGDRKACAPDRRGIQLAYSMRWLWIEVHPWLRVARLYHEIPP